MTTAAEVLCNYFNECEGRNEKPKLIYALIERHTLAADKPAGTILTWSTRKRDMTRIREKHPRLTYLVCIKAA